MYRNARRAFRQLSLLVIVLVVVVSGVGVIAPTPAYAANTVVILQNTGSGTYTVPSDFSSLVSIEVIGGGGGGRTAVSSTGGAGGGGGAYSKITSMTGFVAGANISYSVATSGTAGLDGGDTVFGSTTLSACVTAGSAACVGAQGGRGATTTSVTQGGTSTSGIGTTRTSGGKGNTGNANGGYGGGGGAAGPSGIGRDGGPGRTAGGGDDGGGGGGGSNGGSSTGGSIGTTAGGAGGTGTSGGSNGGTGGSNAAGGAGVQGTGAGGGGGDSGFGGGAGATSSVWLATGAATSSGPGGGGGGAGSGAAGTGGFGGMYGGGAGAGPTGGTGGSGIIVITYTPVPSITISGTLYTDDGDTVDTSGSRTIKLAVGTSSPPSIHTTTSSAGAFSFSVPSANIATGTPMVLWLDGVTATSAVHVSKASTTNMGPTTMDLYWNYAIVSHAATTSTSTTIADMAIQDSDNDSNIPYTANGGTLTVRSGTTLYVDPSKSFSPGGAVTINANASSTDDLDGTLLLPSGSVMTAGGTVTIGGSFYQLASQFNPNGNSVIFNATTTGKTIAAISTSSAYFEDVTFNGSGGAWDLYYASTSNFTVTNGTVTMTAPITIRGSYSNSGTVTWGSYPAYLTGSSKTLSGTMTGTSAFDDVVVSGSYTASNNASTSDFTILSGGSFTAPSQMTVSGTYTNSGTFSNGNGTLHLAGTGQTDVVSGTWTEAYASTSVTVVNSIVYNASTSKYVAAGYGTVSGTTDALVWESSDLSSWTQRSVASGAGTQRIGAITAATGTMYAAVGENGTSMVAWLSTNLSTWTQRTMETNAGEFARAVAYGGGVFVAVGDDARDPGGGDGIAWYSTNHGATWNNLSGVTSDGSASYEQVYGLTFNPVSGNFVATGYDDASGSRDTYVWAASTTIASWVPYQVTSATGDQEAKTIMWDATNGKYVAAGYDTVSGKKVPAVWESANLTSWTARSPGADPTADQEILSIAYDAVNGRYIAAGYYDGATNYPKFWESADLITWASSTVTSGSTGTEETRSVIYDSTNDLYVSGGVSQTSSRAKVLSISAGGGDGNDVTGTLTGSSAFNDVSIDVDRTFSNNASTTDLTIASGATLTAPTLLSISGDYTNSGTFTAGSGTTTLSGSSAQAATGTMTGTSAFYNLELKNTSGNGTSPAITMGASASSTNTFYIHPGTSVAFTAKATTSATTLNANGASGQLIYLRSTTGGTQWKLIVSGSASVTYVDVKDSNACSGITITASDSSNVNSGNNTCWTLPAAAAALILSGTLYADEGVTQITTGKTIKLAVATSSTPGALSTTTDSGAGTFSFTLATGHGVDAGTPLIVYVDGDTNTRAVTVTKATSTSNLSGIDLYKGRAITSHVATTSTSTTIADLARYDSDNDADIQYTANGGTLTVNKETQLYVASQKTFAPGGAVTIYGNASTSPLDGALHLVATSTYTQSATTTLGGSLTMAKGSVFTPGYGLLFNATTTGRVVTGVASTSSIILPNMTFAGGTGGEWTIASLASTSDFTVATGTVVVKAPITIAGNYSNTGTTSWNGNTIYMTGTSKTMSGDMISTSSLGALVVTGSSTIYGNASTTGVTVNSGATLNAPQSSYLTVGGNYANSGTFKHGDGTTYLEGTTTSGTMTGTSAFNDVVANPRTYGETWTVGTAAGDDDNWSDMAYGNGIFVAVGTGGAGGTRAMTSSDGISWTPQSIAGDNDGWYGVTYGNGLFVAIAGGGSGDHVATSPDGVNWTARSAAGDNDWWDSITYGNGLFVVVGHNGNLIMTSPDGINWTTRSSPGGVGLWGSVVYGNGMFVAVGYGESNEHVMTSPDGINWTARSVAGDNDYWYSVTYGNGRFVAVGYGEGGGYDTVMTSENGIDWTVRSAAGDNDNWYDVTYGNGLFVAVSDTNDHVMTSPDGINWTARTAASGDNDPWRVIGYGAGKFVALAITGGNARVMTSGGDAGALAFSNNASTTNFTIATGTVTAPAQFSVAGNYTNNAVFTNNSGTTYLGGAIATGTMSGTSAFSDLSMAPQSMAGETWTAQSVDGNNDGWKTAIYAGGQFVVGGDNSDSRMMTSTDGTNWTQRTAGNGTDNWNSLAYGNNTYVAVSHGVSRLATSSDGATWAIGTAAGDNDSWYGVVYSEGLFVAVGGTNGGTLDAVMTSPDGSNWIVRSAAGNNDEWEDITYGNGLFVAVGDATGSGDAVMTSPDGINWTARSAAGDDDAWLDVTYGNGLFVAVGSGPTRIMTSQDGITWTARSAAGTTHSIYGVTYGNGLFVGVESDTAVEDEGSVLISTDGINWTELSTAGGDDRWTAVVYGNGRFVAVGDSGDTRVMSSTDVAPLIFKAQASSTDFSILSGTVAATSTIITVSGDYSNAGEYMAASTTYLSSNSAQALSGTMTGSSTFGGVTFLGSGTKTFSNNASTTDFSIGAGTVVAPSRLTIAGNYANSGTFTAGSGTTTFTGSNKTLSGTMTGASSLNNVEIAGSYTASNNASTSNLLISAGGTGDATWTFTVSSVYNSYTGYTGTQSSSTGGMADRVYTGNSSVWGSDGTGVPQYIRADFGQVVNVRSIYLAPVPISFDGWGVSYTDSKSLEYSTDGTNWTLLTTTSGHAEGSAKAYAAGVQARYVRLYASSGYIAAGDFYFDAVSKPGTFTASPLLSVSGNYTNNGTFSAAATTSPSLTWTFSTTTGFSQSYLGATGTQSYGVGGLADGNYATNTSIWGSISAADQYIRADFGTTTTIAGVYIAAIAESYDGWGPYYANGLSLQYSNDGSSWTQITTTSGIVDNAVKFFPTNNLATRYIRLYNSNGYVGVGDFYFATPYGTTTFNGTSQQVATGTMTGASAFSNLEITNTSGSGSSTQSILFGANASTTGTLTMIASTSAAFLANATSTFQNISFTGASGGSYVWLRSMTPGTKWGLDVPGTQKSVTYVNVRDSNACSGNPYIDADNDATNFDAGNNTCWTFPPLYVSLAEHSGGQVTNGFDGTTETSMPTYAFRLTPTGGTVAVSSIAFSLSGVRKLTESNMSNALLYQDVNGDRVLDGGDVAVGGAGAVSISDNTGSITFSSSFNVSAAGDYLLIADFSSLKPTSMLTVSLEASSLSTGLASVDGSVGSVQHARSGGGGGGGSSAEVGGAAPPGAGLESGGGAGGGDAIGEGGETIGNEPGFEEPHSTGGAHDEWTNGSNAYNSDASYATAASNGLRQSYANFNFSIPSNNTITGIEVKLEAQGSTVAGSIDAVLSWDGDTSVTSSDTFSIASTSDTVGTLGGSSDTWGRSWSPSEFDNQNFRLRIIAEPSGNTVRVDAIQVKVYHVAGGGGGGGGGEI